MLEKQLLLLLFSSLSSQFSCSYSSISVDTEADLPGYTWDFSVFFLIPTFPWNSEQAQPSLRCSVCPGSFWFMVSCV